MDIYEALYTTRAMRRVKPDAIPEATQARILDAAIRAPTGGNAQGWRLMSKRLLPGSVRCIENAWNACLQRYTAKH